MLELNIAWQPIQKINGTEPILFYFLNIVKNE